MNKKIIILGANGFIAKELFHFLQKTFSNAQTISISSKDLNLEDTWQHECFTHDLSESVLIVCSGLKRNAGETIEVFARNLKIAENLFRLTHTYRFKKVIYLSSCAVYGEDVAHPIIHEEIKLTPTSFYGISKACSEDLLKKSCGDQLVILRPPTIYGSTGDTNGYDPVGFLHKIQNRLLLSLWGDGEEKREFLFLGDLLKVISLLIDHHFIGTLNICAGISYTFRDIVSVAEDITHQKAKIENKVRSKDKVDHFFNSEKISKTFPSFKFTTLRDGLSAIYQEKSNA